MAQVYAYNGLCQANYYGELLRVIAGQNYCRSVRTVSCATNRSED